MCARVLWGLNFEAPEDEKTGQSVIPDIADEDGAWTSSSVSGPRLFPVNWKPRDAVHEELIEQAFLEAQTEWSIRGLDEDVR